MKPAITVTILLFILSVLKTDAQIQNEIKAYTDSTELIVKNGRKMMEARLLENDFEKAAEIYNYLSGFTEGRSLVAFHYTEDIYLSVLFGQWNRLLDLLAGYKELVQRRSYTYFNDILQIVNEKIKSNGDSLRNEYKSAGLDAESDKMLDIVFHVITIGTDNAEYNRLIGEFGKLYPGSRFSDVLKNYFPGRFVKAGGSISLGTGMIFTTGNLNSYFRPFISGNMSLDLNVGRVFASSQIFTVNNLQ